MTSFRIALAQINCSVGDIAGNTEHIIGLIGDARQHEADVVIFPELAVCGYPPEDLLMKPRFLRDNLEALDRIQKATRGITAVVGYVDVKSDIYNAAAVLHNGILAGVHHKMFLPNYGVFDEDRYFRRGRSLTVFERRDVSFGVGICEDLWYPEGPAHDQCLSGGAQLIININASPFYAGKWAFRDKMLATRASDNTAFVAYVNMVGGQDELLFDGHSTVFDPRGNLLVRGQAFKEELILADLEVSSSLRIRLKDPRGRKQSQFTQGVAIDHVTLLPHDPGAREEQPTGGRKPKTHARPALPARDNPPPPERWEEIYQALTLGVRDYVGKNGFNGVVIGLSGGIDSALTAAIAVDALGAERVHGVAMPSVFSADESLRDARELASNLGIKFIVVPIMDSFNALEASLRKAFEGRAPDVTEENMQARIRGNMLMALSNKFGWMVLTTGNKSEVATGYCTLYGDMVGGFSALKDVPKTWVYELSKYRNTLSHVIPDNTITRPPTAELRPDQKDEDSLPPYDVLDPILQMYVEDDLPAEEIVARGFDEALVRRVITLVDRNEYKRRQAAPGVKITARAFGKDRRMPITNRFKS
jgi:NAD+ synthase (glutamine-hydrolysing)